MSMPSSNVTVGEAGQYAGRIKRGQCMIQYTASSIIFTLNDRLPLLSGFPYIVVIRKALLRIAFAEAKFVGSISEQYARNLYRATTMFSLGLGRMV